jgi:hypothetical protein
MKSKSTSPRCVKPVSQVEDVEMRKADLEDVFIDLMAGEKATSWQIAR